MGLRFGFRERIEILNHSKLNQICICLDNGLVQLCRKNNKGGILKQL